LSHPAKKKVLGTDVYHTVGKYGEFMRQ